MVYIYLLLVCLWDTLYPGAPQQPVLLLEACDSLLVPCTPLSPQGLRTEILKGGHGEACRTLSPRWLPQVSLPLAFDFQHIYVAAFLSTVLAFRKQSYVCQFASLGYRHHQSGRSDVW